MSARDLAEMFDVYASEFDNSGNNNFSNNPSNANGKFNRNFHTRAVNFQQFPSDTADNKKPSNFEKPKPLQADKTHIRCTFCNGFNHTAEVCYKRLRQSPDKKFSPQRKRKFIPGAGKGCYICKDPHMVTLVAEHCETSFASIHKVIRIKTAMRTLLSAASRCKDRSVSSP